VRTPIASASVRAKLAALRRGAGEARSLRVEPLPNGPACELAASLPIDGVITPEVIAAEAAGHPLFIQELARHAVEAKSGVAGLRLEDAIWSRIERFDPDSRTLLTLLAIAGIPVSQATLAGASGLDCGTVAARLSMLRHANLARATGTRRADLVEPYHQRVVDALAQHLDGETRRRCHSRLAFAIERADRPDAELLMMHLREAGDHARAAHFAVVAADGARAALAFDRASRLYGIAVELTAPSEARRQLLIRLGDALANTSRGKEAAEAYLAAAAGAQKEDATALELSAADQLLRTGHVDDGVAICSRIQQAIGLRTHAHRSFAILRLLVRRGLLRWSRLRPRVPPRASAAALRRVDTLLTLARGLAAVDVLYGADFISRSLPAALSLGDERRIVHALAYNAGMEGMTGAHVRAAELATMACRRAEQLGDGEMVATALGARALTTCLGGAWSSAVALAQDASARMREQCVGAGWEIATTEAVGLWSLYFLGDFRQLWHRLMRCLREAQQRGDLYFTTILRTGILAGAWLARGDVHGARREVQRAIEQWSHRRFDLQHYYIAVAQTLIDLYSGDPESAHARLTAVWPELWRSLVLRVQLSRCVALHLRAVSAIGVAARTGAGTRRDHWLKDAEWAARRLMRERLDWTVAVARLLRGSIAIVRDQLPHAKLELDAALQSFQQQRMACFAAVTRRLAAGLAGGQEGDVLSRSADAFFNEQRILRPGRMASLFAGDLTSSV
jgi:hypothetical protein